MGLIDSLNTAISNGMSSPLFALGSGLIAGAQPGANPGQQLQSTAANQQALAMKNMYLRALGNGLSSIMGPPQGGASSQGAAAPASAPVVGTFSPAPAAPAPQPASGPSPFAIPTPDQIAGIPVGGMSPQSLRLMALMNGQSPVAADQQIRAQQVALARQQYGPVLARLDTLDKAQSPTQYVKADPALMAQWQQMAPTLGYDPTKDFTAPNVRTAFSFLRNQIAGALGVPTVAPPVQVSTIPGPLGSLYSRNPITNAVSQVKPEEQVKAVVGPGGNVSYVPASQSVGRTPFNEQTYINPQTTSGMASLIASYEYPPLTGMAARTAQGQAIMAAVKEINPGYDATTYTTKNTARMKFAVGKQGDIVRSLSVATNHLDQLSQASEALAQHDFPTFNRLINAVGVHVTGANPVTNFNAMKSIVADEVAKSVLGSSGAESDRQQIQEAFNAARSPAQIQGVIRKYEGLMSGQLDGLRRQYKRATGLNDFDSFVSTMARHQLTSADTGTPKGPMRIASDADYGKLPSGATFIAPDGTTRRKP